MTKQTEEVSKDTALRMAIEAMEYHTEQTRPIEDTDKAIQACKEALAQPTAEQSSLVQEPVCWMMTLPDGNHDWILDGNRFEGYIPLYTTPPSREWVGLSDAEIEEAVNYLNVKIDYPIMFARLIEMHLKEKNT
jgi:hypothetical protein